MFAVSPSCFIALTHLFTSHRPVRAFCLGLKSFLCKFLELTQTTFPSCVCHLQARSTAERDRHAAAPQPGPADATPRGLHSHLHRLCKLQPQAHRRGHLPAARRAQEAHRVFGVSELRRFVNVFVMKSREDIVGVRKIFIVGL